MCQCVTVTDIMPFSKQSFVILMRNLTQLLFLDYELIPYRNSSGCCWCRPLQEILRLCVLKSDRCGIWHNCSSSKFAWTDEDFWYDVILSRWRPCHCCSSWLTLRDVYSCWSIYTCILVDYIEAPSAPSDCLQWWGNTLTSVFKILYKILWQKLKSI